MDFLLRSRLGFIKLFHPIWQVWICKGQLTFDAAAVIFSVTFRTFHSDVCLVHGPKHRRWDRRSDVTWPSAND